MGEGGDNLTWRFIPQQATKFQRQQNNWVPKRGVFWTQNEPPPTDRSVLLTPGAHAVRPEYWEVHEKIKDAFLNVDLSPYRGLLIQFWALVNAGATVGPDSLFSTSNQPFSLDTYYHLYKFRLECCSNDKRDDMISMASINLFPEVIPDIRGFHRVPSFRKAIDYGFTCCILIPVFYPNHFTPNRISSCCGVVRCLMKLNGLLQVFNHLKLSLEKSGLETFPASRPRPYMGITASILPTDEIKDALRKVCESLNIPLGQAWVLNKKIRFPSATYSSKKQLITLGPFILKSCGYCFAAAAAADTYPFSSNITHYYDTCGVIPLKYGEGLVGRALSSRQPHFCRNNYKFKEHGILPLLSGSTHCSCLVIPLRCVHTTDEADYAFEFLWPKTRNRLTVLEPLLLALKTHLPSFRLVSGSQLGGELSVLDVLKSEHFTLLQVYYLPETSEASEKQAPPNGGMSKKRKVSEFSENETESEAGVESDDVQSDYDSDLYWDEEDDVIILAAYKQNATRFFTRTSSTLAYVREKIEKRLNLNVGTYNLKYEFEGVAGMLDTEQAFAACIQLWTISLNRRGYKSHIVVLVEPKQEGP